MGNMVSDFTKEIFLKWFIFTSSLLGLGLLAGFYPVEGNIIIIVIPSALVIFFNRAIFFERLKLSTLLIMRVLVVFAAVNILDGQLYVSIALIFLVINIAEATFTDIIKYKKYFNGIAGIFVGIGVIVLNGIWIYDVPIGPYYLVQSTSVIATICYILAYTLWNWIFVTHEFSQSVSLIHIGFLLAPILGSIVTLELGEYGGFGMWLMLRANTLSIGGWLQISIKYWFEDQFKHQGFNKIVDFMNTPRMEFVCMVINIILICSAIYLGASTGCLFG